MGFDVARTGIASVGFIGFPSVGKSTLMSGLTGTTSEVAAYEFTTLTTVPGTMDVHGARLQILDLPGIIEGAKDGKGRGRQVIAVARTCNLIFIVLDVCKPLVSGRSDAACCSDAQISIVISTGGQGSAGKGTGGSRDPIEQVTA
jgi:small GTP-binding protein